MKSRNLLNCKYEVEQVWLPCSESILEWGEEFHELMLNDSIRMNAYKSAIQEAVKPGMIVLDLGTGTGILGLWALQAGAKHLYAIDVNSDVLSQAVKTFDDAGFSGMYSVFEGLSYDTSLPTHVDLIISEIMGNLGDNEDFVPILKDAKRRFLKDGGKMLPSKVCSMLVPISSLKIHQQVNTRNVKGVKSDYDINSLIQNLSISSLFDIYYDVIIPKTKYLSTPQLAKEFKMDMNDQAEYKILLSFKAEKDGILSGFKGSFIANLSDSVALDISGDDIASHATSDSWKHCYLPIELPVEVKSGDEIYLNYSRFYPKERSSPFRQCYEWSGTVTRQGQAIRSFHQSMENTN
jgi:SAM-dependent methyltransferase